MAQKNDYGLVYRYTIVNMHTLINKTCPKPSTPDAIGLANLGDFKQHSKQQAIHKIISQLHDKVALII